MNIYFKDIRVLNPAQGLDIEKANLWIKNGLIAFCGESQPSIDPDTRVVEAAGWVCSPGLFDMHVHFRDPGYEYKEDIFSGCRSAANGGFTGVVCMPNTNPIIDNAQVVDYIRRKAAPCLTDVFVSATITQKQESELLSPMFELHDNGAVMFTDDGAAVNNANIMRRAFDYAMTKDLLLAQHCEERTLSQNFSMNESVVSERLGLSGYPAIAEEILLMRDLMLAEFCGNPRYHVQHISTRGAVRLVADAKKRSMRVSCEVAPHHFTLNDELIATYSSNYKMNPPLRTQKDVDAILDAIANGTIDCIASDHAPHALNEKDVEFESAPNGVIGLETTLGVALTQLVHRNIIGLDRLIELMAINPRKLLNMTAIEITEGTWANISIFDPNEEWIVDSKMFKSKATNTCFDGMKLKGKPKFTINKNQMTECEL
ncbi:MAG: dihydroorotase [Candidatus Kapaibacterium sp.]